MSNIHTATNSMKKLSSYLHSLSQTPHRLRKRMLATWTPDQEFNQVRHRSGADMKRKLKWHDLVALGVGGMLGVGVFVTTGSVALHHSGPSVFISYIIAGISALLSSLCYTEFAVQVPVAGGAFSYLRLTFGEFLGYFAGANILMEYVFSNAAVARSFTEYLSIAFGENDPNVWRVEVPGLPKDYSMLDFPAYKGKLHVKPHYDSLPCYFLRIHHNRWLLQWKCQKLGFSKRLAPFGARGVLDGAAIVYFSYIGYDSASTMAEEVKDPFKSLPIGIVGSVLITTLLYCLMALSLCMMVPYNKISEKASFSIAFLKIGWNWASNLVGAGASLGIVASLLVAMLGQARYLCVIGRARLVPSWALPATIALFTELDIIIELISIGTLLVFYMVANALIYRRYVITSHAPPTHTLVFLFLLVALPSDNFI
ncbi:Cationic amino acid transporter 6, chloroplastic [Glycine soja]|uniref:Cationic amino acid transporter 6, chloroplastic n=1 Tax=Glycine soja TaxID=3848 RepID=A0A445L977_GLYSO|nr:Cationic amino acid transporter 6, chloroplastic [Glycine soja]